MAQNPVETFESLSYGLGYPNPYPFGFPEGLPNNSTSQALEASHRAFSGQGRVLGFTVSSTKGSGQFVLAFDTSAVPANGAIPFLSIDIATVVAKGVAFDPAGRWCFSGFCVANSSTQGSLTIGSADCLFDIQFVPQVI